MNLDEYIKSRNITKYRLSQLSGVPKTTILDICSGKTSLQKSSARTIWLIAKALNCSMEFIMTLDEESTQYDSETGLPINKEYLEKDLPPYLQSSIKQIVASWEDLDSGKKNFHWDMDWCELNADINSAELGQEISSEQAWYLREKYLRIVKEEF